MGVENILVKQFLELGEFVSTHGVMGEIKLYPWCDGADFAAGFEKIYIGHTEKDLLQVERARAHKNTCIFKIKGVDSLEIARQLIGKTVLIDRVDAQLPKGRFFVQDLFGAKVVDAETGMQYGVIKDISRPGKHDVYTIEKMGGETVLFPAVEEFVREIDIESGVVKISPIAGMFDDETLNIVKKDKRKKSAGGK